MWSSCRDGATRIAINTSNWAVQPVKCKNVSLGRRISLFIRGGSGKITPLIFRSRWHRKDMSCRWARSWISSDELTTSLRDRVRSTRDVVHDSMLHKSMEGLPLNLRHCRCGVGAVRNGSEDGELPNLGIPKQWSSRLSSVGKGWFIATSSFFEHLCKLVSGNKTVTGILHTQSGYARAEVIWFCILIVQYFSCL